MHRRIGVARVELAFDEATARAQGSRCLICSINPVFDGELCIACNGCVDVCPQNCLKLVRADELSGEEEKRVAALVQERAHEWGVVSAMLLDPARCIRCGLCAARCPTEAVAMESFRFTEELAFEKI